MLLSSLLAAAQLLFTAGCENPPLTLDSPSPGSDAPVVRPSISDGAHGGADGFYFLPPLVDEPAYEGTFDPDRSPTVGICTLTETGCDPVIASFTRETGPGSETVRVDTAAEHYVVNWHTDEFDLAEGEVYRIRVLLEGREAGHADVVAVASGKEMKNAETGEQIALKDGRTLPIKFRIEEELVLEFTVPAVAPDTVPEGLYSSENIRRGSACITGRMLRGIVIVTFYQGTPQAEKQEAIELVDGEVIGGSRPRDDLDGHYYVRVEDDPEGQVLCDAVETLRSLPQVINASEELFGSVFYRRPDDGAGWSANAWELDPASVESTSARWGLEAIAGSLAWGCSIGDSTAAVAVVDHGFQSAAGDLMANVDEAWRGDVDVNNQTDHGTRVASVLAARGDNGDGIAGTMWTADLRLYDVDVTNGQLVQDTSARVGLRRTVDRVERAAGDGARVINLSMGIGWQQEHGRKPGTEPDSIDWDLRQAERYRSMLRTALEQAPEVPLIVLAAGKDGEDAKWAGFPQVKLDFPSRVLVVGAATVDRNLTAGSNRGDLVEITAPGGSVTTLDGVGNPFVASGTSFAAPYVSGVAGLLASFDPRLSSSEMKDLILDGADRGGRGAGGIPLLNAYEALKAAAERDDAPLCGNRVWTTDGNIVARRTATVDQTLVSGVPEPTAQVEVLHGGKHLLFITPEQGFFAQWSNEGWGSGESLPTNFDELRGGTRRSVFGDSHGRDTIARIDPDPIQGSWFLTEDSREVPVSITVGESGTPEPAGKIVVNDLTEPVQQTCIERDPNDANACVLTLTENRAWLLRLGYPQYPDLAAPNSRKAMVTVNPLRTLVVSSDEWTPCGVNTSHECRRVDVRQFHVEAEVATLDLKGGAGETPVPVTTLPDESVFWIGQSENGGELVLGTGEWLTTWEAHADNFWTTGTPYFNGQQSTLDCRIEYRDRSSFSSLLESIPTLDACEGGTIAYPSIGSGGGTIAPSVAPSIQGDTGTADATMLPIVTSRELESSS